MFAVRVLSHQFTLALSSALLNDFAAAWDNPDMVTTWDNERI